MTEPEIARRCPTCGASIRDRAFFCPQCGNEITEKTDAAQTGELNDESSSEDAPVEGQASEQTSPADEENERAGPEETLYEPAISEDPPSPEPVSPVEASPAPIQRPAGAAPAYNRNRIKRAAAGARDSVEGDMSHRVEKLRKISHTVLDEAAYDPSLRFLLIAAVLFGIFLFILLLNKLID